MGPRLFLRLAAVSGACLATLAVAGPLDPEIRRLALIDVSQRHSEAFAASVASSERAGSLEAAVLPTDVAAPYAAFGSMPVAPPPSPGFASSAVAAPSPARSFAAANLAQSAQGAMAGPNAYLPASSSAPVASFGPTDLGKRPGGLVMASLVASSEPLSLPLKFGALTARPTSSGPASLARTTRPLASDFAVDAPVRSHLWRP